MIARYVSETWAALAPALGDHLWQSSLFAAVAGLLTLVLRQNHARTRYWLWLAASLKFLIPFSLFVGIGAHLIWTGSSGGAQARLSLVINEIGRPFTRATGTGISRANSGASPGFISLLPFSLAAAWLCGFAVILSMAYVRWRRVSVAIRKAVPICEGREMEALRRVERLGAARSRIRIRLSPTPLEPGIFGVIRPVLVWPEGISEHLEDAHLEAIVAHEVAHVRRHDNLAAAIHMLVEAAFWFHPLVWWLGLRLLDERERACDEQVLELGSERRAYAESILKTCQFCAGVPPVCVSGVTGADLKKRIVAIMSQPGARKLTFGKKLLLGTAGVVALTIPVMSGALNSKYAGDPLAGSPANVQGNTGCSAQSSGTEDSGGDHTITKGLPVSKLAAPGAQTCSKSAPVR